MSDDGRKVIMSDKFVAKWADALGIKWEKSTRLIIDCEVGKPIRIYVSYYGTDALLGIEPPDAHGVEIIGGES